jgi:hypothetical protein
MTERGTLDEPVRACALGGGTSGITVLNVTVTAAPPSTTTTTTTTTTTPVTTTTAAGLTLERHLEPK